MQNAKETTPDEVIFEKCPQEWIKIMKHIRSLKYVSRPDYKLIYECFRETLIQNNVSYSDPWDWEAEVFPFSFFLSKVYSL